MTTNPDDQSARTEEEGVAPDSSTTQGSPGAEIGITEGEGSTFEPEEDPEAG